MTVFQKYIWNYNIIIEKSIQFVANFCLRDVLNEFVDLLVVNIWCTVKTWLSALKCVVCGLYIGDYTWRNCARWLSMVNKKINRWLKVKLKLGNTKQSKIKLINLVLNWRKLNNVWHQCGSIWRSRIWWSGRLRWSRLRQWRSR